MHESSLDPYPGSDVPSNTIIKSEISEDPESYMMGKRCESDHGEIRPRRLQSGEYFTLCESEFNPFPLLFLRFELGRTRRTVHRAPSEGRYQDAVAGIIRRGFGSSVAVTVQYHVDQ